MKGFRTDRSCHYAIRQELNYLNGGYEWVMDIDISAEKVYNVFENKKC